MLTHKDRERELECIKSLYHMSVDGIVLCPINKGEDFENFLLSLDTPAIAVNNRLERIAYIGIDNRGAMRDSAEHCIKEGYEKLIYVMPKLKDGDNAHAQEQRLLGFQDAVTAADIPHVITHVDEVDSSIDDRQRIAVVCASDFYAQKLYQKYKGKNVGIIGFDDQRTLRELGIAMDSVAYDVCATAKSAIAYLLDGVKPTQYIPHRIVKRGSV
jgi:LacI family transcriptional regulator